MEENTSASFQNSLPSEMAMSIINEKSFVFVPFQWERKKTETGKNVQDVKNFLQIILILF